MTKYFKDSLTYTDDGRLLTSAGHSVMMDWEDGIMKESAKVVCENGGKVLNIGFGMGIIDTYIQNYSIKEHWIIEKHPDVLDYMRKNGWFEKSNVHIIQDGWENVLYTLPTFDGIYFDTWDDPHFKTVLIPHLSKLLNKHGIFSYWGTVHSDTAEVLKKMNMNVSYKDIELTNIPNKEKQGKIYWKEDKTTYRVVRIQDNKINPKTPTLI